MNLDHLSPEERQIAIDRQLYAEAGLEYPGDKPPAADAPQDPPPGDPPGAGSEGQPNTPPVDEEAIALAAINRRRGTNFATLEEALAVAPVVTPAPEETPEQKAEREKQEKQKREADKLTFGLSQNLFTTEQYNNYQVDKAKSPRQVVLEEFLQRQEAKGVDRAEAELEFERKFPEEDEDVADALQAKADRLLKARYPEMRGLDRRFDAHLAETETTRTRSQERQAFLQSYTRDVDEVVRGIAQRLIKVRTGEGDTTIDIPFDYKPQVLEQVKNEFAGELAADRFAGNYSRDILASAINYRLQELSMDEAIGFAARKFGTYMVDKKMIGRKHMNPDEPIVGEGAGERDDFMYQRLQNHIPPENQGK